MLSMIVLIALAELPTPKWSAKLPEPKFAPVVAKTCPVMGSSCPCGCVEGGTCSCASKTAAASQPRVLYQIAPGVYSYTPPAAVTYPVTTYQTTPVVYASPFGDGVQCVTGR